MMRSSLAPLRLATALVTAALITLTVFAPSAAAASAACRHRHHHHQHTHHFNRDGLVQLTKECLAALVAAHIWKIGADHQIHEIEAMGFVAPSGSPTGR